MGWQKLWKLSEIALHGNVFHLCSFADLKVFLSDFHYSNRPQPPNLSKVSESNLS